MIKDCPEESARGIKMLLRSLIVSLKLSVEVVRLCAPATGLRMWLGDLLEVEVRYWNEIYDRAKHASSGRLRFAVHVTRKPAL